MSTVRFRALQRITRIKYDTSGDTWNLRVYNCHGQRRAGGELAVAHL
jgi:hypothetical protein